jgi:zinc-ribbon domain
MALCPNCGANLSQRARFCSRCGAPQRDVAGFAPSAQDVCEIRWWRGYVKAEFYALALDEDGQESEIARSAQFLWRRSDPPAPDHARATAAHEQLVARLTAAGWEPLGKAVPWYAQRFRRPATGLRVLARDEDTGSPESEESSNTS